MRLSPSALVLLACFASAPASAFAQGLDPEATFHRAYFLEHERGELQEALALYRELSASASAGAELQREARTRASIVAEDIASQDLAALMPAETILFAECARPGAALVRLLGQLGLIGSLQEAAARRGFAVPGELVEAVAGIRGAALALTRLPADGGSPGGVLVLHAGNLEALRGGLAAAILARGTPADPIEEVPAWTI